MDEGGTGSPSRALTPAAMSRIRSPSLCSTKTAMIASRIRPVRRRRNHGGGRLADGSPEAAWRATRSWIRWSRSRTSWFQRLPTRPITHASSSLMEPAAP